MLISKFWIGAKKKTPGFIKVPFKWIRDLCQWDNFHEKTWAQEGEDIILSKIFSSKLSGFYVDVGAHHPKRFSNTYRFYKKGWRGINIDARPGCMRAFDKTRPRDINIEKPISLKKEILTYYAFNEPALNGFSKEISEGRKGIENYKLLFTIELETETLEKILDQNMDSVSDIDFLSIDVEGLDLEVLKSNNFQKYRPKVILIEMLTSGLKDVMDSEVFSFLKNNNYVFFVKTFNTCFFIECDFFKNNINLVSSGQ